LIKKQPVSGERTIPANGTTDQPRFEILINNDRLPETVPVQSLIVYKELNRISRATIIILDGNPSEESFEWSSSDHFIPGNEIEIKAGYDQNTESLFKGIIVAQKIKARSSSDPLLTIECRDTAYKMTLARKNRYYSDMNDSDIISQIINEYGIQGNLVSTTLTNKQMVQYRSSDWDFIVMRAEANGMCVFPDDGIINLISPDVTASADFSVIFGADMIEFDGEMDARLHPEKSDAKGWDYASQDLASAESGTVSEAAIGNITSSDLAGDAGYEEASLRNSAVNDTNELQLWADSRQFKSVNSKIRGRAKFIGKASVKPGIVLDLQGLGQRMSGATLVWGIRHEITRGGWTSDVELGIPEKFFHEICQVAESQAGGLLPPVNGLETGIVTAIEGDPDNEYRIKVKIPALDNQDEGIWARICTLDAGNSRGTYFRPEISDEVILGFLNDDPRSAIVLGMLNSSAKPAPSEHSDDNHEKGFVTRSGMKVWFNDDMISMVLETPNGNIITLSDDEGKINITDENGNTYEMSSDGITVESPADISIKASGDVTIEGMNININANTQIKAAGSAAAEFSSGGTTTVKGSLVQIN